MISKWGFTQQVPISMLSTNSSRSDVQSIQVGIGIWRQMVAHVHMSRYSDMASYDSHASLEYKISHHH